MGASITLAGENLIALKQAAHAGLKVARFLFANVPGLDPNAPVDRAAAKPAPAQIVHTQPIGDDQAGYVNPNQVVYSAQVGSDVGDWDFNWIGLETAENVLFAVAYVPLQQKRRNIPPLQIGNNLTRNFLLVFDGAQALTGVTIDASTWQHDFTVRLAGIDERQRLSNYDLYGVACFIGNSLQVEKVDGLYRLKRGHAYVRGLRIGSPSVLPIIPPAFPTTVWIDVSLQRDLNNVVATWSVVFAADYPDYTDSNGVQHYCVALADLPNANTISDRRPTEAIDGALVTHFAARQGDYAGLRARATTKEDVGLGNVPNAISDDPETNSSAILATTKALKSVAAPIWSAIANIVSGVTVVGKAARLATARKITLSGAMSGTVNFDGSADVTIDTVSNLVSTEGVAGSFSNLRGSATGLDSNVKFTADELCVKNALGQQLVLKDVSITLSTVAFGPGGLDTGPVANNTWYSVWVIWNGSNRAGLLSLSATAPLMPAGYTHKARVGWVRTDDGAKYPLSFIQSGPHVQYKVAAGSNVQSMPLAASGSAGSPTAPTWVAVSVSAFVPPTAGIIMPVLSLPLATSATANVAPNTSYGGYNSPTNPPPFGISASGSLLPSSVKGELLLESSNIYWASNSPASRLYIGGWEDSL
ncbi:phage tail protein [Pseudomonas protegens]|uniref:phage tail protein n=1 Tax=Pseudomonas protegens TaxID=380021 RepID=UPI001883F3A1|nr:phage tail protein [Pseudomonas protegens]MBF0639775.1 phage tail protein [Pseudomonas protegens]